MKFLLPAILLLMLCSPHAAAEQGTWHDKDGNAIPETASTKSKDGFGAFLVVTADKDWQEKWNTPVGTVPSFTTADSVDAGGELFVLSFLSNPLVGEDGMTDVSCDFIVLRPDGSKSIDELDMPCFKTKLPGDPKNLYLSAASLKFVSEPTDLRGEWIVRITLKDNLRKVELALETSFIVK
ncbi:MAG: hypothetical protein ACREO1_02460 [Arenimonas sp.]